MSWAIQVKYDDDKVNVGTVTSTFTDADATTFTFSLRIQATQAALNVYVAAAVVARNAWQAKKTANAAALPTVKATFVAAGEAAP